MGALLEFHPRGEEKFGGTVGIKIAKSPQGDTRCFYLVKPGGTEDVSMKKCIDAVELNPPYVKAEKKIKEEAASGGEASKQESAEVAKPEESKDGKTADEGKMERPEAEENKGEKQ